MAEVEHGESVRYQIASPVSDQLEIGQLNNVLSALKECNFPFGKWFTFGLNLGLSYNTLEAIRYFEKDIEMCLIECLSKWLKKSDGVTVVTWQKLVIALQKIDEKTAAEKLEAKASGTLVVANPTSLPHSNLEGSKLVNSNTHRPVPSAESSTTRSEFNCTEFTGGTSQPILESSPNSTGTLTTQKSLKPIEQQHSGTSSLTIFSQVSSCSSDIQDLTQSVKQVEVNVAKYHNFEQMRQIYGRLRFEVIEAATKKFSNTESADELKEYLWECCPETRERLKGASSARELMKIATDNTTIINFEAVKSVIDKYDITEAKELIKEYNEKLNQFCSHTLLTEVMGEQFTAQTFPECQKIEFVLDWIPNEYRLKDIEHLLKKAFDKLCKKVIVTVITPTQSIAILCYAPLYLMKDLLLKAQANLSHLKEESLIRLSIGGKNVYDRANNHLRDTLLTTNEYDQKINFHVDSKEEKKKIPYLAIEEDEDEEDGSVDYGINSIRFYAPSRCQVKEEILKLQGNDISVGIRKSTPNIVNYLSHSLLNISKVTELSIQEMPVSLCHQINYNSLSSNNALINLRLSFIDDDGVVLLARSLKDNTTLTLLDLADNCDITDTCITALSQLLLSNTTIKELFLQRTSLTCHGVQTLLDDISVCKEMKRLISLDKKFEGTLSYHHYNNINVSYINPAMPNTSLL